MRHYLKKGEISTKQNTKVYDITGNVKTIIKDSQFKEGHIIIQPMHTTVGIYINEGEERLLEDIVVQLNKRVSQEKGIYLHDDIEERDCPPDEPLNGHSHIKSMFYSNPFASLILYGGEIQLGKYQKILFAEFDGPCPRKLKSKRNYLVSIIGD